MFFKILVLIKISRMKNLIEFKGPSNKINNLVRSNKHCDEINGAVILQF